MNRLDLYVPPEYLKRKIENFAIQVRDKLNSYVGDRRFQPVRYDSLPDKRICLLFADNEKSADEWLMVNWSDGITVDEVVSAVIEQEELLPTTNLQLQEAGEYDDDSE